MKIFIIAFKLLDGNYRGYAIDKYGIKIADHISSSIEFVKHDMGLTSNWKHDKYKIAAENYELVDLTMIDFADEEVKNALYNILESIE